MERYGMQVLITLGFFSLFLYHILEKKKAFAEIGFAPYSFEQEHSWDYRRHQYIYPELLP
jgi:hypothetical protein